MRSAILFLLALLPFAAEAELSATATVHASRPLYMVSPLSYGTNIVLSGVSNEKLADLVGPFQRMGITNLRLHLNNGIEYLWEDHAPKPGTRFEDWGIFDPLRDNSPFDRVKALKKVVDAGNTVTSDHFRRTDLRCSGVIIKVADARNAYGEVRLTQPADTVYARCDVWLESADAVTSPEESPWTLIALRNAEGRTILCAQIEPTLAVHGRLLPDIDNPPTSDASPALTPREWHSIEIAAQLGEGGWATVSYDGELIEKHEDVDIPGGPITHGAFGCVDNAASGKLWIDGCRVDDEPFEGDLGNGLQHLGRVTFDRAPINTDDFIHWCREAGIEPLIQLPVANIEDSQHTDDSLAKWFEYCNGSAETEGGKLRASRAQDEPYGVTYWELGNEPYYGDDYRNASEEYAARIVRLAERMRAIDPDAKFIANTNYHDDQVFPVVAQTIDMWGLKHFYQPPDRNHTEEEWLPWALGSAVCRNRRAEEGGPSIIGWWYHGDREKLEKLAPGHGDIPLAQTEYDLWLPRDDEKQSGLLCALYKASVLGQHIAEGVEITQSFYFPRPGTTVARMHELWTSTFGDTYLACDAESPTYEFDNSWGGSPDYNTWEMPYVSVFPSRKGEALSLMLINRHQTEDARLTISVAGAEVLEASARVIESDDLWATDLEPRELPVSVAEVVTIVLPNQSIAALTLDTK